MEKKKCKMNKKYKREVRLVNKSIAFNIRWILYTEWMRDDEILDLFGLWGKVSRCL